MIFLTQFFNDLNVIESKKNYIVHRFHGITPQNRSTESKKLWFEPLMIYRIHYMIFMTFFFYDLNFRESKKNYIVHRFHGGTPQNRSTKLKILWFEPLQQWLSIHLLHFKKNTLMIFLTFFFYELNVIESKKQLYRAPVPWNNTSK